MERNDLKKVLAGVGLATLVTGGVVGLTAQPALSAWSGSKQGAVSTPAPAETVVMTVNATPVKNAQELQKALDALEAGKSVTIAFQSKGKAMILEGVPKPKP